jgi:hypothetical protein
VGTQGSKRSAEPVRGGVDPDASEGFDTGDGKSARQKKRGWREVEAWRERKFLRESLAEIWDDDPLIDESVFSGDDSDVDFYSDSEDVEVEEDLSDYDDEGFYDEED